MGEDWQESAETAQQQEHTHPVSSTGALTLGALGVVYGDIGTSPIYAFREAVRAATGDGPNTDSDILGILSLIVWSLTLIVAIKYMLIVLRADNRGEGGVLSLMALARHSAGRFSGLVVALGMVGAALFYGDAVVSPAISVLSAVEGLEVVTPAFNRWIIPIAVAILIGLFFVQKLGTAKVAKVFGPLTALWFVVLAGVGLYHIILNPTVLVALNPYYAIYFLFQHSGVAVVVFGAIFLAITGAETLYADLGHFGRKPIMLAWFILVFPALLLNYFGQGAYVLENHNSEQPLFEMMPEWGVLPFVILAMLATVIAGQAAITGAFSLTRQAIQLNLLPRLDVQHTSAEQSGQIYVPQINTFLLVGVVILVLAFGSSSALTAAYGIALSGAMVVTGLLLFFVIWKVWAKPLWLALSAMLPFFLIELAFFSSNLFKVKDGGWVTIAIAIVALILMATWRRGSRFLFEKTRKSEVPLTILTGSLAKKEMHLVDGTAVFLTGDPESAPTALLHSLKHYKVLHKSNIVLSLVTEDRPRVPESERAEIEEVNHLFTRVILKFGFMEQPNVPKALAQLRKKGLKFDIMTTSFFLSRRTLKPSANSGMPIWQDRLFIVMARNASEATAYFQIPTGRVVEIGTQVII
ncbi:potassium transporter Kup [Aquamicrobium zhengzhouense]|uniref:Probable potassium transport system protein Kup n=1 Tax=Aquamicrobium zhengzhouense TaxID=2781738 RepID=A0ABS0S8J6_9HYPH|nr:potassium transporter Kup [Aquamicrobium zhengzhouense]MBI1619609.1 potassium transporter Kup [Aquamicrobium zhengzhouense]